MNQRMSRIADATIAARNGGKGACIGHYSVTKGDDDGHNVYVSYRGTIVAHWAGDIVTLDTGGYKSPTTKNVINAALAGTGLSVFQKDWDWFVTGNEGTIPFERNMKVMVS